MEFENLLMLIKTVSDSEVTELHYEENGTNIRLVKEVTAPGAVIPVQNPAVILQNVAGAPAMVNEAPGNTGASAEEPEGQLVKSPLVGTFYVAPAEDADPFVTEGKTVKKGQTLGIVEAMKLMNEIESEFDGTVAEILVENGQMVEFGQPLFRIR